MELNNKLLQIRANVIYRLSRKKKLLIGYDDVLSLARKYNDTTAFQKITQAAINPIWLFFSRLLRR